MKYAKYLLLLPFAFMASCGGEDSSEVEVPANVQSAFEAAYPGATEIKWEMEGEGYEVEFEYNDEHKELVYGADGMVVGAEPAPAEEMNDEMLPEGDMEAEAEAPVEGEVEAQ